MSDFGNKLTRTYGKVKLGAIKHSPEILLTAGIVTGVATVIFACKGTLKAGDVIDDHKKMMDDIKEAAEIASEEEYSERDQQLDTVKAYSKTAWEMFKIYAPAIGLGTLSLACVLTSHGIMRKRNLALAASVATLRTAYDEYRSRVVRDLGKDMDEHFLYDTVEETVEKEVTDPETGKTKKKKEKISVPTKASVYSRFFDEANPNWTKTGSDNYFFIRGQLNYLQQKLVRDGYLFLNDAYKALGFPITIAGQTAGWIYDYDNKDNTIVSFVGFEDKFGHESSEDTYALMNGYERNILLSFDNLKDSIIDDLPRIDGEITAI